MGKKTMVSKSDYDLCDAENSNLRRHLLWAAQFLSPEQKVELRKRVTKSVEDGGVTDDELSDSKETALRRDKAINLLCDYCDTIQDDGTAAAHCQGGHSDAGQAASKALGVPYPIKMDDLERRAKELGHDTEKLWPWLYRMRAWRSAAAIRAGGKTDGK